MYWRLVPGAAGSAVESLGVVEPLAFDWPDAAGALDDPVIAAVGELGAEVARVVEDTYRMVDELLGGGRAALAVYEGAQCEMSAGVMSAEASSEADAFAEKVRSRFAPRVVG